MKTARISLIGLAIVLVFGAAAASKETPTLGPVETLQSFQKALAADPPQVQIFWTSLPASYQTEIKDVISTFADKTDADLWNATFRVLGKTAKVARNKEKFIRQSPLFTQFTGSHEDGAAAPFFTDPRHYKSIVNFVETIVTSDIATHNGLKNLDPGKFLATTGTKVAKSCIDLALAASGEQATNELEKFRAGTFTLVEENGDNATVKFAVEGQDETEIKLTKVEDKWVFAELAADFEKTLAQSKGPLAQLEITAEQKTQILSIVKAFEMGLDDLLAANTQEAFDATSAQLAQKCIGLVAGAAGGAFGPQHGLQFNDSTPPIKPTENESEE